MPTVLLPDKILDVLNGLESGSTPDETVTNLIKEELRRRLARYQLTDRLLSSKYGMTLDEFETQGIVAQSGYTFEVESDHQDWDLAIDGILTIQHQLAYLQG